MSDFLVALGLVLVLEGLVFAVGPEAAKRAIASVLEMPDSTLRMIGLVSAGLGVFVVWLVRG